MIWKCRGREIEYGKKVLIMAIVNVTPDSFSDGGDFFDSEKAAAAAVEAEKNGADIIDVGAQSTRPGASPIRPQEEWERLKPVLSRLRGRISVPLSVDTFYPAVAEKAIAFGAEIINDVSGRVSPEMARVVSESGAGWILLYGEAGAQAEASKFFDFAVRKARELGVSRKQICLDMGIGFGKTRAQDMSLIANIPLYKKSGFPLLLGASRKRVIEEGSGQKNPKERIYGNIAADTAAVFGGADIIRLHDVKNEKQGIYMAERLRAAKETAL